MKTNLLRILKKCKIFKFGIGTPWYIFKSLFLLSLIRLLFKILEFQKFKDFYEKILQLKNGGKIHPQRLEKYIFSINAAGRLINSTCLQRALVLKFYLRDDAQYKVIIGVKYAPQFMAHAWVEKEEKVIFNNLNEEAYHPIWQWA